MSFRKAVAGVGALLLVLATALAAGCRENPNEHVQSNEFFRPSAEGQQQQAVADSEQQEDQENGGREAQQGQAAQSAEQDAEATDQPEPSSPQDQSDSADEQSRQEDDDEQDAEDGTALETSEDIVRRYSNPSYGYSLELVCPPFCDATSTGIDRVTFRSETGRALVAIEVFEDDGTESPQLLRRVLNLADTVVFSDREDTTTVTGEPAEQFIWEEDRRATGGFHVRWKALLVRLGDLVIVVRAGSVMEDYEGVAFALDRGLNSFILPLEIEGRPGRYNRFDFVINYDPGDFAQEFGQPTNAPPSEEAGIFVLQSTTALKAVLTWQVLGEAFYDGDTAIAQSLREALGIENVTGFRDAADVDGTPARTGETETQFGEGVMKIQSFAWYCRDSGREFVLHVLDPDDPESVALPLIESFRCTAEAAAESGEGG